MIDKKPTVVKRIVVYIPAEDHKQLRAKLILQGETVSNWLRSIIQEYLKKGGER